MLNEMSLCNFKAFGKEQRFSFAPITLLYGPNSGGKSTIIQSLLLLKQSFHNTLPNAPFLVIKGEIIDLANYDSMIFQHDIKKVFKIELLFEKPSFLMRDTLPYEQYKVRLEYSSNKTKRNDIASPILENILLEFFPCKRKRNPIIELERIEFTEIDGEDITIDKILLHNTIKKAITKNINKEQTEYLKSIPLSSNEQIYKFKNLDSAISLFEVCIDYQLYRTTEDYEQLAYQNDNLDFYNENKETIDNYYNSIFFVNDPIIPLKVVDGNIWKEINLSHDYNVNIYSNKKDICDDVLKLFNEIFRYFFETINYIGPLRSRMDRVFFQSIMEKNYVGLKGENTSYVLSVNKEDITNKVNEWLIKLQLPYKLEILEFITKFKERIMCVQLEDINSHTFVSPFDVGSGLSQLLPIIVQGLVSNHQIIFVEQPELHLHPKLQGDLADFFINTSIEKRYSNQWIIETHSEALIIRLLRRIREKTISNYDVSVLYVNPYPQGSKVIPLRIDEFGEFIDDWPNGFFEETFHDMFGF